MKSISSFFKRHLYLSIIVFVIVIVVIGYSIFGGSSQNANDVLVVHPQTFNQQLSVSGTVIAAQNVDLGFAQSGRVTVVYAKVGDQVVQGKVLAQVENGDLQATLLQRQAALQTAQANLRSVKNGTRPEQLAVSQSQVTSDQTALTLAQQTTATDLKNSYALADSSLASYIDQLFNSPRSNPSFGTTISGSNGTSYYISGGSLQTTLSNERQQVSTLMAAWNSANQNLSTDSGIAAVNTAAASALQAMQTLASNISLVLANYSPQDTSAQTIYNGFRSSIASAATTITNSISLLSSAVSAQSAAKSSLAKDQSSLQLAQAGATQSDIDVATANVKAAEADVANAAAELTKTTITAPFDGIVTKVNAKVGETANANDSSISMNSNGVFQIESYVPEVYVSTLHLGDLATTTLDAYGPDTYFSAKVIAIDPAETIVNGVSNYKTTLQFVAADDRIKAGMTAAITISTGDVPNAFVVPQGAIFSKNNQQYVQLQNGKKIADVVVATGGSSSIGTVQIISGLRDGDAVVLAPDTKK